MTDTDQSTKKEASPQPKGEASSNPVQQTQVTSTPVAATAPPTENLDAEPVEQKQSISEQINKAKEESENVQDESAELAKENQLNQDQTDTISSGDRLLAALGYISWLCILPLVLRPKSKYCQIHGKQGLIITLGYFFIGWMGILHPSINVLIGLIYIGFMVFGIIKTTKGAGQEALPGVGKAAEKLEW